MWDSSGQSVWGVPSKGQEGRLRVHGCMGLLMWRSR